MTFAIIYLKKKKIINKMFVIFYYYIITFSYSAEKDTISPFFLYLSFSYKLFKTDWSYLALSFLSASDG